MEKFRDEPRVRLSKERSVKTILSSVSRVLWQAAKLLIHITLSFSLVYLGLYLVVWTQVAQMLLITVVFYALPVLALGGLELIFGGYRKIPFLGWFLCLCTFSIGVVLSLVIAIFS